MKNKNVFVLLIMMTITSMTHAQSKLRTVTNFAFGYGEKLNYKVKYNLYFNVPVGEINFDIANKPEPVGGNNCYHITGSGRTYSFYDPFYKIRDKYETYLESSSLLPMLFIRKVQEGSFDFGEYVVFNQIKSIAKSKKRTQNIPKFTQDVLSAIYFSRTFNYTYAKPGQDYILTTFIDDSTYSVGVRFVARETIETDLGAVRCIKLKPILIVGRLFKSNDEITLWVSDDPNHIPIRIESGISVGKIRADLNTWSGLKNPLSAIK